MRIMAARDTLLDSVSYHATEGMGLHPVIESDQDAAEWVGYVLCNLTGYSGDELRAAGFAVEFPADPELIVIQGNQDVIEAVRFYLL